MKEFSKKEYFEKVHSEIKKNIEHHNQNETLYRRQGFVLMRLLNRLDREQKSLKDFLFDFNFDRPKKEHVGINDIIQSANRNMLIDQKSLKDLHNETVIIDFDESIDTNIVDIEKTKETISQAFFDGKYMLDPTKHKFIVSIKNIISETSYQFKFCDEKMKGLDWSNIDKNN